MTEGDRDWYDSNQKIVTYSIQGHLEDDGDCIKPCNIDRHFRKLGHSVLCHRYFGCVSSSSCRLVVNVLNVKHPIVRGADRMNE